jgi:hypothetical protein
LEFYRVVPLPAQFKKEPVLKVVSAKSGNKDIPAGKPQQVVEDTPGGRFLQVRVPIQISLSDSFVERMRLVALATQGMKMELEGEINK